MKEDEPPELSLKEKRALIAEQQQKELLRRKEAGELEPYDYEKFYIWWIQGKNEPKTGRPVTRKDVENHAIVIKPEDFETLGHLKYVNADGRITVIDFADEGFDKDHPLIIFPEQLGDKEL